MRLRFLVFVGAVAAVAAVSLAPVTVVGQTPSSAAKKTDQTWTQPRTAWGDPDLQGLWTNATITPLERPDRLGGKQVLTEEEVAALEDEAARTQFVDSAPREGDPGTYNRVWSDRGTKVVGSRRTSLIVDPPDGKRPPLTSARAAAVAAATQTFWDGPEDRPALERCITRGVPNGMLPGPYNNNYRILQSPGYVALLIERIHDARIIPTDGRPHLSRDIMDGRLHHPYVGRDIRQWMGDSRGHWEGNTLVVDTIGFSPIYESTSANLGGSGGGELHLVERFTRVDADTINYEFTVDDPTTFTRPWTAAFPFSKTAGPLLEYACHEGNYAMEGILGGARVQEKVAKEAATTKQR